MSKTTDMENYFGKKIDLLKLKKPVLSDLRNQSQFWTKKAQDLLSSTKERDVCPLCSSRDSEFCFTIHGFPWRQCRQCTHVFNSRMLTPSVLDQLYKERAGTIKYSDTYTEPSVLKYRLENVARPKVDFIQKFVSGGSGRWLDVGSGNGDILKCAKERGFKVLGIEPNADSAQRAVESYGVEVEITYLDKFVKKNKTNWNIISMLGLLDLVPNPLDYLKQAHSLLETGGTLAISMPNFNSLSTSVQSTFHDQVVVRHMYPTVLNIYTEKSVEYMLEECGFKTESIWFFGMDVYEMINNLVLSTRNFEDSPLHKFLLQNMCEIQQVIDSSRKCDKFHFIARKQQ